MKERLTDYQLKVFDGAKHPLFRGPFAGVGKVIGLRLKTRFGDWIVTGKIDEGGFGQVYLVKHTITKKMAALKAESNDIEGGSAIKLEIDVLRTVNADGEKQHIPMVYHAAKHRSYSYMIITLLGENLKALKVTSKRDTFSVSTWTRVAIQALYALKTLHDYGFIHRDIKPQNFLMGHSKDAERVRLVHLLDFGLARAYAYQNKDGSWRPRMARGSAEFRGTLRYVAPTVHHKLEQGRRDDVWSWFYLLIELHAGLPWQTVKDKEKIESIKMNISDADLVINMPRELRDIVPSLRKLNYYQKPDYQRIYSNIIAIMKRYNITKDEPYDWERADHTKYVNFKPVKQVGWTDAEGFFSSDPINIHKAPDKKLSKLSKEEDYHFSFQCLRRISDSNVDKKKASEKLEKEKSSRDPR